MSSRIQVTLLLLAVLAGCADPREDWQAAQAEDTTEAYERFLARHPDGAYAERARARMTLIAAGEDWARAEQTDTIPSYERYLREHPDGSQADVARARVRALEQAGTLEAALVGDDAAALRELLAQYPDGPEAERLQRRLQELQAAHGAASRPTQAEAIAAGSRAAAGPGVADAARPAAASPAEAADGAMRYRVQLGAFRSAAAADAERSRLLQTYAAELAGLQVQSGAADNLHRIRSAPMSREAALRLCRRLGESGQACVPVPR